jgi:hypothetical protein
MKAILRIFLLSLAIHFLLPYETSSQTFNWAKCINHSYADGIKADQKGNTYVTGYFLGTAQFDTIHLTAFGDWDIFIAMYDPSGNCLWAKQAGGSKTDENSASGIAVNLSGNSYITGALWGTTKFDSIQLTSFGDYDIFVAKYDPNGKCLWAKHAGGPGYEVGLSISIDAKGNSYVTGDFRGTIKFDTIQLTSIYTNLFLAKYDPNGNCLWAKQSIGGASQYMNIGFGISVDVFGNSFITGQFGGITTFGTIQLTSYGASTDIFIAKYDSNGNCLWVKQAGGSKDETSHAISIDTNGSSYITGVFKGTSTFDTIQITSLGRWDIFVAKYDPNGNCLWVKQGGGNLGDGGGYGISADENGNSYITGDFEGTISFGNKQLTSIGAFDIFIANYDPNGNCIWVKQAGSGGNDRGCGISIDQNKNSFVTGFFDNTASFDTIQLSGGGAFITKFSNQPQVIKDGVNTNPTDFLLQQNFPNPFNPNTIISYSLPSSSNVKLIVYNTLGQTVKVLENGFKNAGNYSINFNASDSPAEYISTN